MFKSINLKSKEFSELHIKSKRLLFTRFDSILSPLKYNKTNITNITKNIIKIQTLVKLEN
jgi:hypothetical protein